MLVVCCGFSDKHHVFSILNIFNLVKYSYRCVGLKLNIFISNINDSYMELSIIYVSKSIDDNKVSWHLSIKWFHKGSSVSCLGSLPSIDSNNRSSWDSNLGLASFFAKPRTEMDLVLNVISNTLLH